MITKDWQAPKIAVRAVSEASVAAAQLLGERLSVPVKPPGEEPVSGHRRRSHKASATTSQQAPGWELVVDGSKRSLRRPDGVLLSIDFTRGRSASRRQESGLGKQPLARALGFSRLSKRLSHPPTIVDATGGLGRDTWFAASLGCHVTMIERSPIVHVLLESALLLAMDNADTRDIAARVDLRLNDATRLLPTLSPDQLDVIYLDPMYPPTRRRAEVTKGMQFLHALLGPDINNDGLLESALAAAGHQVTVKRPPGSAALPGDSTFTGQRSEIVSPGTRYDVYLRS